MTGRLHSVRISTIFVCFAIAIGCAVLSSISCPRAAFAAQRQQYEPPDQGGGGGADLSHSGDDDQPTITGRKDARFATTTIAPADGESQGPDRAVQQQPSTGLHVVLERVQLFLQFYLGVQR